MTQEWTETRASVTTTLPTVGNKKQRQVKVTTVMNFTIMAKQLSEHPALQNSSVYTTLCQCVYTSHYFT